MLYISLAYK